jgi:nucleoside-diphosphate-sugar epimerase
MKGRILVLGGAGHLGYAAALAFRAAGWQVASLVRGSSAAGAAPGTEIIEVDARDCAGVVEAAEDADVVLHALNPPFADWPTQALPFADTAIAAACRTGATLVLPGNVYNYGANMPPRLDEATPMRPTSRKGMIREAVEARLRAATDLRCIVLRAGDFFGGPLGGSWLDRIIIRDIGSGRLTWPGPLDVVHEWAYLPDFVQALVRLVEAREQLEPFAQFGFAGHAVTGREFVAAISRNCGREFRVGTMPWWLLRPLGVMIPMFRELSEIAYLWTTPHMIDGTQLMAAIGELPHTPFDEAVAASLAALGLRRRRSVRRWRSGTVG